MTNWKDKESVAEYNKNWLIARTKNEPEKVAEAAEKSFKNYYVTSKGRAAHMLNNARARAKRKGIKCELTEAWLVQILDRGICEVTGIPLVININGGKGHRNNPFSPSIDRIIQDGDYTPENCRVTVWIYNRARGAFSDDSFDIMIDNIIKNKTK